MAGSYALRTQKLKKLQDVDGLNSRPVQPVVVVLCGAYNPFHNAHLASYAAAKKALESQDQPEPFVVLGGFYSPVSDAYGKPNLRPFSVRLAVIEAALHEAPEVEVDTWEGMQPTYTRTYRVLEHMRVEVNRFYDRTEPNAAQALRQRGREVRVVFSTGADLFCSFFTPKCWRLDLLKKLLDCFIVVVLGRDGYVNSEAALQAKARSTVLTDVIDGVTYRIDFSEYKFIYGAFDTPDDTASTHIREALAQARTTADASSLQKTLEAAIMSMVPPSAVALVVKYFGESP